MRCSDSGEITLYTLHVLIVKLRDVLFFLWIEYIMLLPLRSWNL